MPQIEIRLFNSLARYQSPGRSMDGPSTVGEVLDRLQIPEREIYLVLLNGRNIMHSLGGGIEKHHLLQPGDVLALSGPVPFSRAYGAPVV